MEEKDYVLGFSTAPGAGPKSFQKLLKKFGEAKKAWSASLSDFESLGIGNANFLKFNNFRKEFDFEKYLQKLKRAKVEFIPFGDKFYPPRLSQIDSPPIGLFTKGNKNLLLEQNNIGVVGARKITSYGREVTEKIVSELARNYIVITSGMAMGVDSRAHKTCLANNGKTIAVLGCGVDCPYPRENEKLYENILDSGGLVISEYPLGMNANAGTFPARNRIIAALSLAVLITEAAEDSGSLITADYSLKFGKRVFAVPGPINSRMSMGTLKLLKEGAVLVSSGEDIISELNIKNKKLNIKNTYKKLNLKKDEKRVYEILEHEAASIDNIYKKTKMSMWKLMTVLSNMELMGIISNKDGKWKTNSL